MGLDTKQIGWIVAGLIVIGISYYIGFVGWTETKMMAGDQGYGLYEVTTTYPIAGIVGFLVGIGLMGNALDDEDDGGNGEPAPTDPSTVDPEADTAGNGGVSAEAAAGGEAAADDKLVCPDCGASIETGAEFCTSCGAELSPEVA